MVIMDSNMPKMSGPAAAKEMRRWGYKGLIIGELVIIVIVKSLESGKKIHKNIHIMMHEHK